MKTIFKILLLFSLWEIGFSQQPKWEVIGNMPFGLSAAEVVADDSLIYFIGGFLDSLQIPSNSVIAYNPQKKTWYNLGNTLRKRKNFVALKYVNSILAIGGDNNSPPPHTPFESFNTNSAVPSLIDTNKKFNRYRSTGTIINNTLYLIGGISFGGGPHPAPNNYIIEYDLIQKKISYEYDSLFSGNKSIVDQMCINLNGNIYIFGGLFNTVSNMIYQYDTKKHDMIKSPITMLQPRANGRAVAMSDTNVILLIGGYNERNFALNIVESYQIYSNNNIVRKIFPQLNYKRRDLMAVNYKGKIYVFGGLNEYDNAVLPIEVYSTITDVDEGEINNRYNFELEQNYPNPFNPSTTISFTISKPQKVQLKVYDYLGKVVSTLIDEYKSIGKHTVDFDGRNLTSGVYFYELKSDSKREVKKMMMVK